MTEPIAEVAKQEEPTPLGEQDSVENPPADEISDNELDPRARKAMAKLRNEAATNRIRAQEAEAKVAALEGATARLAALEHAEIERVAAEQLIDAGDVWRIDPDTQQSWYDQEFKQLQPDKVRESIETLVAAKPHLARAATPPPSARPIEGLRPGASPEHKEKAITWNSALRRTGI